MKFPGFLSISRVQSNHEDDLISITVGDAVSRCEFAEVTVSIEEFGYAITGRSEVFCNVEFQEKAPLGRKKEDKFELVPRLPARLTSAEEGTAVLAPFEVDGWVGSLQDLHDPRNEKLGPNGELLTRVRFTRYVDREEVA